MGFGQGLSGLDAAANNLDVIGNNIANGSTIGFKRGYAQFADIYSTAAVGIGTQVAAINQSFSTGTISTTSNPYDIAIDGEKGFFRVLGPSGEIKYTRNGQFLADEQGFLVNVQGDKLTGFQANGTDLQPIRVPAGNIAPRATGGSPDGLGVTTRVNVNANVAPITVAFDPSEPATYNHSLPINVYDSLGNSHQMIQYFTKTAGNTWRVDYGMYQQDGSLVKAGPTTTLVFDESGQLESVNGTAGQTSIDFTEGTAAIIGDANPFDFQIDYVNSTQYGGDFNYAFTQDGFPTGEFASMSIEPDGRIVASYTNGETAEQGYLVLADFTNVNGLKAVGGNAWVETGASGQPILGRPGTNSLATVVSMALEESNVDMSQELVNLIIAQRTYQANAQTIKTQDQILQTLMQMR